MWNDDVTDDAAALTYYSVLVVLPALLVTVITFALVSPGTAQDFIAHVTQFAPGQSGAELHDLLVHVLTPGSATWTVLVAGSVSAVWSACSYLAVFRRSLHRMHGLPDSRSPWRKAPRILATALGLLALLVVSALVLLLSGPVVGSLGRLLRLDAAVPLVWTLVRWPLLLCLVAGLVVIVFHTGPPPARRRGHSLSGGALSAALWLAVSAGFALYTSVLGTYSRIYGSLAGTVVFLVWLWLSNLALLTGAQFTAELGRRHASSAPPGPREAAPAPGAR
ncbi:YihY/virulence factor BrkB family protein [Streptomyces genisteinicus]|uniref:YihY/virulence factor BrkB family protein n=1 Tax=Streptomyces genisteinicus TaxID=2768068 RepID=A0A7H0HMA4_9ACTN|nr:YihY/virulence factor BrkB family protein [Streptomyces genisteinicus]QNP61670.1 YihY/virulence factor BrkB family protein [Streptomyces genisteinicus]